MTTDELERAFQEAKKLSEEEQQRFGAFVLKALESEKRWNRQFEESTEILDDLADEALESYENDDVEPLDPNEF